MDKLLNKNSFENYLELKKEFEGKGFSDIELTAGGLLIIAQDKNKNVRVFNLNKEDITDNGNVQIEICSENDGNATKKVAKIRVVKYETTYDINPQC